MCFKVRIIAAAAGSPETYEVTYRGVRVISKTEKGSFEYFLEAMRDVDGMTAYMGKADTLLERTSDGMLEFMVDEGMGISFTRMKKNGDIFDSADDIILRAGPDEVDGYLLRYKAARDMTEEQRAVAMEQLVDEVQATAVNNYDPDKLLHEYGLDIPPSDEIGFAPDLSEYARVIDGNPAIVLIKLTGSRELDYAAAAAEFYRLYGLEISEEIMLEAVWHHLDDFNLDGLTCTMQLVSKQLHNDMIDAHIGAVRLWEAYFRFKYKK